jgi:hypothetical protein
LSEPAFSEKVGVTVVGYGGSLLEWDEGVVGPGENDLRAHFGLNQLREAQGNIQNHVFFQNAVGSDGAVVVPPVTGVDYDPVHFEAQSSGE